MGRCPTGARGSTLERRHTALSRRDTLKRELLRFIAEGSSATFDALALEVARYQRDSLPAYGALVRANGQEMSHWRDAPFVPTEIFREVDLSPPDVQADAVFLTSGTTGVGRQGMRRVPDLELYHAGCRSPFIEGVLAAHEEPIPWLSLIPSFEALPDSSLSHMVSYLGEELSSELVYGANADGLLPSQIQGAMEAWHTASRPYLLLTTSFALVRLFDTLGSLPQAPSGSSMMLTGGFKGKSRTVSEDDLLNQIHGRLGIHPSHVVGEYGMTELSSQAYGTPFQSPPWLKMRVIDPITLKDMPPGEQGLVGFFDLLNLDNVSAILTSDLGVLDESGQLSLHGRAPGSRTRGCSLRAEEWETP